MKPASLTPFHERSSFDECQGAWALSSDGVLVQIKDWVSRDGFGRRKFLIREDAAFIQEHLGRTGTFEFHAWEDTLTPVDPSIPNWLEKHQAKRLDEAWSPGMPSGKPPRF